MARHPKNMAMKGDNMLDEKSTQYSNSISRARVSTGVRDERIQSLGLGAASKPQVRMAPGQDDTRVKALPFLSETHQFRDLQ